MDPPGCCRERNLVLYITDQRTKHGRTQAMRYLVDRHFPGAAGIRTAFDNLSIHTPPALYEASLTADAGCLLRKLDLPYTLITGK